MRDGEEPDACLRYDPAVETFSVTGGVAGHTAMTEDLHTAATAIREARYLLAEVSSHSRMCLGELDGYPWTGTDIDWRMRRAIDAIEATLWGTRGSVAIGEGLADAADRLEIAVAAMEEAETAAFRSMSLVSRAVEWVEDLIGLSSLPARTLAWLAWEASAPRQYFRLLGEDPYPDFLRPELPETTGYINGAGLDFVGSVLPHGFVTHLAAALAIFSGAIENTWGEARYSTMRPRTLPASPEGATLSRPPANLTDLMRGMHSTERLRDGAVTVQRLTTQEGDRYIVTLPGTQDWLLGVNPVDGGSNLRALSTAGSTAIPTEISDAMLSAWDAMIAAEIPPDAEVMLVGHSQGGIGATALAAMPEVRARFNVTHVVTAGSCTGTFVLPGDVQAFHVEHPEDMVPGFDLTQRPDLPNRVTFTHTLTTSADPELRAAAQTVNGAHGMDGYIASTQLAESGVSTSVDVFAQSAKGFLDPDATLVTMVFEPVVTPVAPLAGSLTPQRTIPTVS